MSHLIVSKYFLKIAWAEGEPGIFFGFHLFSKVQLVDKSVPMSGFKPQISDVRSGHSTN